MEAKRRRTNTRNLAKIMENKLTLLCYLRVSDPEGLQEQDFNQWHILKWITILSYAKLARLLLFKRTG